MGRRVLVTGVKGFIGGAIAEFFSKNEFEVIGLSRKQNISSSYVSQITTYEPDDFARIVQGSTPDVIVHAAGASSVNDSFANPSGDFNSSVRLCQSVFEGIRLSQRKPLVIYLSSAAVYGNPESLPVREDEAIRPISPYGFHKYICECVAQEYSSCFSIPVVSARLFSVFGPRQKKLLFWDVYQKFKNDPDVTLNGTGNETRDYLYVDDVATAVMALVKNYINGYQVVNIGSGVSISVRDVAVKIKEFLHSNKEIEFTGLGGQGNPSFWQADISRYLSLVDNHRNDYEFDRKLEYTLHQWMN